MSGTNFACHFNTYDAMGKFDRQQTDDFFLIFPIKQDLTFHATCPIGDNLHEMSNPIF